MATNTSRVALRGIGVREGQWWRRWLLLVPIFVLALLVRWHYAPDPAYYGDLDHFARWIRVIDRNGVLNFYESDLRFGAWDRTYPPLSTLVFEGIKLAYGGAPESARLALRDPAFVALLKLLPIAAELALIAAVYAWLIERPVLRTLIPGLLAIYPGLIVTSAWWGQYDAPFTLFVLLALIALNRERVILAWVMFAVAVLFKQPAVIIAPVLLVLSYRRYGLRQTAVGIAAGAAVGVAAILPFFLSSGFDALDPFLKMNDAYPYFTNNAYNFWYGIASIHKGSQLMFEEYPDGVAMFAGVTYKAAGLVMFAVFVLLLCVIMWRRYQDKQEFIWAAALYMGFFMLPTQVHERYLYPAAVLMLIGIAQDTDVWVLAAGIALTFTYNVLGVLIPYRWRTETFATELLAFPTAVINIVLFGIVLWYLVKPRRALEPSSVAVPEPARG